MTTGTPGTGVWVVEDGRKKKKTFIEEPGKVIRVADDDREAKSNVQVTD